MPSVWCRSLLFLLGQVFFAASPTVRRFSYLFWDVPQTVWVTSSFVGGPQAHILKVLTNNKFAWPTGPGRVRSSANQSPVPGSCFAGFGHHEMVSWGGSGIIKIVQKSYQKTYQQIHTIIGNQNGAEIDQQRSP